MQRSAGKSDEYRGDESRLDPFWATLYLTPVFYTYMAALHTRLGSKRIPSRMAHEPEPVATGD